MEFAPFSPLGEQVADGALGHYPSHLRTLDTPYVVVNLVLVYITAHLSQWFLVYHRLYAFEPLFFKKILYVHCLSKESRIAV